MKEMFHQKGVSLVEVIVAAAIIVIVVLGLFSGYIMYFRVGVEVVGRVQAILLAEEAIEAVKFLRDDSWDVNIEPLTLNQPYYLVATSSTWKATTTPSILFGKFTRSMRLYSVNRDSNGSIVTSGGTLDLGTKKVVVTIWWSTSSGSTTRTLSTYISDIFNE